MGTLDATLAQLAEWDREAVADGVVLRHPHDGSRIRVRPRMAGKRLAAVFRDVADEVGAVVHGHPKGRRLVTYEAELGAICSVRALRKGKADIEISVAVTGGAVMFCVDGVGDVGLGVGALVEQIAKACDAGQGRERSRMFEYAAPTGWHGVRRDGATMWLHPQYPRVRARIHVFDSRTLDTSTTETLHRRLFMTLEQGGGETIALGPSACDSDFGLHGRSRTVHVQGAAGRVIERTAAALADGDYMYQATFEGPAGEAEAAQAFADVVRSIRPLPASTTHALASMSHWVD